MRNILGLLCAAVVLLSGSTAYAAVVEAASCSSSAIQAAVNSASSGDIVNVPACDVSGSFSTVSISKTIWLRGAGLGSTKIRKSTSGGVMFFIDGVTDFEMSGFELRGQTATSSACNPNGQNGSDTGIRITHGVDYKIHDNHICNFRYGMQVIADPSVYRPGVIYENSFEDILVYDPCCYGYGIQVRGEATYPGSVTYGDVNWVFIEDNTFDNIRHNVQSENGSRYVFRYNTITNCGPASTCIDAHGQRAYPRGSRAYDIYENTMTNANYAFIMPRGGDGNIYNNTMQGSFPNGSNWIRLEIEQSSTVSCSGSYPQPDIIRDTYIWGNSPTNTPTVECSKQTQLNRDYYVGSARPGYTAYTYPHPLREAAPPVVSNPTLDGGYVLRSDTNTIYIELDDPNGGISADPATGFSCAVNSAGVTLSNVSCASGSSSFALCSMDHDGTIDQSSDTITCSYDQGTGNVEDTESKELEAFTDAGMTNYFDHVFNLKVIRSGGATSTPDAGRPVGALFDDDFTTEESSMLVSGSGTMTVEFDLINATGLVAGIVAGDDAGNYYCTTYDLLADADCASGYSTVLDDISCNSRQLVTTAFSAQETARCWKAIFTGPAGGTQAFELNGEVGSSPPDPEPPPEPPTPYKVKLNPVRSTPSFGVGIDIR